MIINLEVAINKVGPVTNILRGRGSRYPKPGIKVFYLYLLVSLVRKNIASKMAELRAKPIFHGFQSVN